MATEGAALGKLSGSTRRISTKSPKAAAAKKQLFDDNDVMLGSTRTSHPNISATERPC